MLWVHCNFVSLFIECGAGMVYMLSIILLAAAPLSGKSPAYAAIPSHKDFVGCTKERCNAVEELCNVSSEKGLNNNRCEYIYNIYTYLRVRYNTYYVI